MNGNIISPHDMTDETPRLLAYCTNRNNPMPLVRASNQRQWMDETRERFAYRCLPLLIANQAGWFILNTHHVRVQWTGKADARSLKVEYLEGGEPQRVVSHFGHGVLTWIIPYLFRTPPGYNLLVRGPANMPKDGIAPLDGVVESDWATASFTMNWKITRPNYPIEFEIGEPICMIVPQRRGELEAFQPEVHDIAGDPRIDRAYHIWSEGRGQFLEDLRDPESQASQDGWQRHYFQGVSIDGLRAPDHQTILKLRDFVDYADLSTDEGT